MRPYRALAQGVPLGGIAAAGVEHLRGGMKTYDARSVQITIAGVPITTAEWIEYERHR